MAQEKCQRRRISRYLKPEAVPSVFPGLPAYFSSPPQPSRSTARATASTRREYEEERLDNLESSFRAEDDITDMTLAEIAAKITSESTIPKGFSTAIIDDRLFIHYMTCKDDMLHITSEITVRPNKSFVVILENKRVPSSEYKDLCDGKLTSFSQILNLMARLKNWHLDPLSQSFELLVQLATNCLRRALSSLDDADSDEYKKVSFAVEQLELCTVNKHARLYSPQVVIFAYLINASSSATYNLIREENVLSLPSATTLRKVNNCDY